MIVSCVVSPSIRHPGSYFSSRLSISCMLSLTEEDMSEALPCRSPNEAQLNIRTNEVRAQNIFQHPPEKLSCLSELETRILMSGSEAFGSFVSFFSPRCGCRVLNLPLSACILNKISSSECKSQSCFVLIMRISNLIK